ncbi:MAG TPA: TlpA disulfide reductase family protein [Kofleriaceae bacterium]|nr:TlpA disulfide reductase family protein [Kofleriaceae bacterium]
MATNIQIHGVRLIRVLAAIAALCSACQHASEPPVPHTAAGAGAAGRAPDRLPDAAARPAATGTHEIGAPAPAMRLTTIDGQTIDLAAIYGTKPVYLKFWATWCVPCREQMPGLKRIYDAVGDRVAVIAVNVGLDDDEASVRAFREQYGLRMPVAIDDGRLAAALDLRVTVQHVVIGRDARLVYVDHRDGDQLDAAIQKVLSGSAASGAAAGRQPVALKAALRPGDLVQGLTATAVDGTLVPVGRSPAGRPRALVLFSTWCESYLATSRPEIAAACRRVREDTDRLVANGGVDWLGVAGGPWQSVEDIAEYQATTHAKIPLAYDTDGSVFRAFGIRRLPTIALLDAEGRVVRVVGPDDRDLGAAVQALQARK